MHGNDGGLPLFNKELPPAYLGIMCEIRDLICLLSLLQVDLIDSDQIRAKNLLLCRAQDIVF